MSEKEFLKKLSKALNTLPQDERTRTIAYYSELIEDRKEAGATEEAAVNAMGDIDNIATEILSDAKERGVEIRKRGGAGKAAAIMLAGVLAAVLLFFVVVAILQCGSSAASIEWTEVNEEYSLGAKRSVNIDLDNCDLLIKPSQDNDFHLTYYTNEDLTEFTVSETNESLSLVQRSKDKVFGLFYGCAPDRMKRTTILLVPNGFTGSIVSSTAAGKTDAEGLKSASYLELAATTGSMSIQDVEASDAKFTVTTGELVIHTGRFAQSLEINGTTGSIRVYDTESGTIKAETTTGEIRFENAGAKSIGVTLTTGEIHLRSVHAQRLSAHSTTGSIRLDGVDSDETDVTATTGSIRGQLPGHMSDYTIESSTSTGSNNLPQTQISGSRKLSVRTTTGSIKITFGNDE